MTRTTKTLLAISLTAFALGFTDILWGFGMPVGAIFLGLCLISKLLGKEAALYDEEQKLRVNQAMKAFTPQQQTAETRGLPWISAVAHSR